MPDVNKLRSLAIDIAMRFLGKPYKWGGDDPIESYDCSGLILELLKSVGILPRDGDWTASGLWDRFTDCKVDEPYEGCLILYNNGNNQIIHVELCIGNGLSIGASGGGSTTLTEEDAIKQNAYIKIRPYKTRKNIHGYVDPFLSLSQ